MKTVRLLLISVSYFVLLGTGGPVANAQESKEEKEKQKARQTKEILDSKKFVFLARFVYPMRGGGRELITSDYDLRVTNDTVQTFLPYFGRAFSAPTNPSEGGIRFTSTDFDYAVATKKKSWEISIKPKDIREKNSQELFLSVFPNGQASLRINSLTRDPISYSGYIEKIEEKK